MLMAEHSYSVFNFHIHVLIDLPSFDRLKKENWFLIKSWTTVRRSLPQLFYFRDVCQFLIIKPDWLREKIAERPIRLLLIWERGHLKIAQADFMVTGSWNGQPSDFVFQQLNGMAHWLPIHCDSPKPRDWPASG